MTMDVERTRPYRFGSFSDAVDRLFEQGLAANGAAGEAGYQSLPINVWETPDGYQAVLLAPGLNENSMNVTVHEDTLAIDGELQYDTPQDAKAIWQEFKPSRFRRSLRLGASVDPARVEAIYRNGLLLVTMPKAEHAKPRQIRVQVAADAHPVTGNGSGNAPAKAKAAAAA